MKTRFLASLVLCALLLPQPLQAWGLDVHRLVTGRAIDLLPATVRPFYEKHRSFIAEHSVDPDLWRNVGFMEEPPRHYLDLDSYGAYPFKELPRDRQAAIQKFGREKIEREGELPWRVYEGLCKRSSNRKWAAILTRWMTSSFSRPSYRTT